MAEYSVAVGCINMKPNMENATSKEINLGLTKALGNIVQKMSKDIDKINGGSWEIVSHGLTKLGNKMVVSFLLHR
jgi:hypothetical protein